MSSRAICASSAPASLAFSRSRASSRSASIHSAWLLLRRHARHIVEDVLEVGPRSAGRRSRRRRHAHLLTRRAVPAAGRAPVAPCGTRKVAQWVFSRTCSQRFFSPTNPLSKQPRQHRTSVLKRTLLATASLLILIVLGLATISFFNNHALEERVAKAPRAVSP